MGRLMYDSTTPWDIPRDAELIAYYVDGLYAWPQAWLDLFPRAKKVGISAIGVRTAQVGDVEVGCIWPPPRAVPWVERARADGYDPTIYVNELNDWLPVRQAFWAAGVPEPHYWVARYNGVREIPAGSVGRQFAHPHDGDGIADRPWETGGHFDLSWMADYWPGVDTRAPGGGGGNEGDEDEMVAIERVLPGIGAPKFTQVQCPAVGMSEPLPDGPETWAQVQYSVPHSDAQVWGLWAIVTKGVNQGQGEAVLLAGPGEPPSGETGDEVVPATLAFDTYVKYWLPKGTFAVSVLMANEHDGSILITGGKTKEVSGE